MFFISIYYIRCEAKILKKNITVLGIHFWHDAGAALVQNGRVIAAINEERI